MLHSLRLNQTKSTRAHLPGTRRELRAHPAGEAGVAQVRVAQVVVLVAHVVHRGPDAEAEAGRVLPGVLALQAEVTRYAWCSFMYLCGSDYNQSHHQALHDL